MDTTPETIELFVSEDTIKRLLETGHQRFRRGLKEGYTFTKLAITPTNNPLPEGYEACLSRDRKTLYVNEGSARCLRDTGSVTCSFGEKTRIHFYTEKGVSAIQLAEPAEIGFIAD